LNRFGFKRVLIVNTPIAALLVAGFALMQESTPTCIVLAYIFAFGLFRSVQWASTGNLAYSDIAPEQLSRFSALYYILWQLAVAISVGLAAAMLSLLAGGGQASVNDYRLLFVVEGLITLCALLAYFRLTPQDGAHVSGHGGHIGTD
ncbi:MAG: multidrug efflux MFS transporter, partial [Mesorhizobium sp.]